MNIISDVIHEWPGLSLMMAFIGFPIMSMALVLFVSVKTIPGFTHEDSKRQLPAVVAILLGMVTMLGGVRYVFQLTGG